MPVIEKTGTPENLTAGHPAYPNTGIPAAQSDRESQNHWKQLELLQFKLRGAPDSGMILSFSCFLILNEVETDRPSSRLFEK